MEKNEITKEVEVAKMTNWQVGAGFYRVASDPGNSIRAFKGLKVLTLEDEPPVIEPLNDRQLAASQDMLKELSERGDLEGFTEPTACVRFKRALLIQRKDGVPKISIYAEGMTLYVADPSALTSKESRLVPACIVNAAFDEVNGVPSENTVLNEKELLFTLLLAASVLNDMDGGSRSSTKDQRFDGVPVQEAKPTEAYVKVQCLLIEGNLAMLDGIEGGTEMRVYGKVPIFIAPGATYSVQDLSDTERDEFESMAEGKFKFTKGVIFNGKSAMVEQLDSDDEESAGFAFGSLKGLASPGTTITRHVAWLPKDVVEAGGWPYEAELPAPLPEGFNACGEALEEPVTL